MSARRYLAIRPQYTTAKPRSIPSNLVAGSLSESWATLEPLVTWARHFGDASLTMPAPVVCSGKLVVSPSAVRTHRTPSSVRLMAEWLRMADCAECCWQWHRWTWGRILLTRYVTYTAVHHSHTPMTSVPHFNDTYGKTVTSWVAVFCHCVTRQLFCVAIVVCKNGALWCCKSVYLITCNQQIKTVYLVEYVDGLLRSSFDYDLIQLNICAFNMRVLCLAEHTRQMHAQRKWSLVQKY